MSYAQKRLWFLEQLMPNTAVYHMPSVMKMEGELHVTALEKTLQHIVERHEVLRTTFDTDKEGQPIQIIHPTIEAKLGHVELDLPDDDDTKPQMERILPHLERLIDTEVKQPFDLQRGPLIRATLVKVQANLHYLVVVMHHIVSDGWSFGVFAKAFMRYYQAYVSSQEVKDDSALPIQYADFAEWQQAAFEKKDFQASLSYWKDILTGDLPILQLPTDHPSPAEPTFEGARYTFKIGKETLAQLKKRSHANGCTLYMMLLAAYQVLLHRYTRQTDLIVGSPVANRHHKDVEQLIGFFVNTLALRVQIEEQDTFASLLQKVKRVALGAFNHQSLPFEVLVEELQPDREANHSPIFQTMFVLQNAPQEKLNLPQLTLEFMDVSNGASKVDLLLTTMETNGELTAAIEYRTDLFRSETISQMARHWENILTAIIDDPTQEIHRLPMLSPQEVQLLCPSPEANQAISQDKTSLIDLFEQAAKRVPQNIALVQGHREMTYEELDRITNQWARYLQRHGVQKGDFVGLCLDRCDNLIIGMLSILKSGAAYLPLDPHYPKERLAYMMADAGISTVLTDRTHMDTIQLDKVNAILLDEAQEDVRQEAYTSLDMNMTAHDLAYILYTSGSTGQPKGVLVEHGNVVRLMIETQKDYHFTEQDVWTLFHSYAFDFSVWEIWGALVFGGKLVIVSFEESRSPEAFLDLLLEKQVTVLNQTPSAFKQLLQVSGLYSPVTYDHLALRYVIFGGEALELHTLRPWFDQFGDERPTLVNMYGITETTVHVTYRPIHIRDVVENKGSVIGRPIADLYVYILDEHQQPVPNGVPGELYVGGGGVTRGYWHRHELTADRFIQNPFTDTKDTLYRTGDLVKRLPTGELEYLGRIDKQVKVRGFRIELGEIEAVLNNMCEVKESVVTTYTSERDKRLVSYLILDESQHNTYATESEWSTQEQQLEAWAQVFNDYYQQNDTPTDPTFNIIGWNSTYTHEPIPAEEMRGWLDSTVERILALNPSHVLEIGIGTGMILYRVAPHCHAYIGTDISQQSIAYTKQQLPQLNTDTEHIALFHRPAHECGHVQKHMQDGKGIDTIILNSIVQYFPSREYLDQVLENAIGMLEDGGTIFIGDVRSYEWLAHFYMSLELVQSDPTDKPEDMYRRVQARMKQETELVINQAYFNDWKNKCPQVTHVTFIPKEGGADNELTKFRYDVILHVSSVKETTEGAEEGGEKDPAFIKDQVSTAVTDLNERLGKVPCLADIESALLAGEEAILIRDMINTRVLQEAWALQHCKDVESGHAKALDTVQELKDWLDLTHEKGQEDIPLELEHLFRLAQSHDYQLDFNINEEAPDRFDCLLYSKTCPRTKLDPYRRNQGQPLSQLTEDRANDGTSQYVRPRTTEPLKVRFAQYVSAKAKEELEERLPQYMVPHDFVIIDHIPLTTNGKADLKALPIPVTVRPQGQKDDLVPQTEVQSRLLEIWRRVLGTRDVGLKDHFFQIGGHSLLATQLIHRVREDFDVDLPLRALFEKPTVQGMADVIQDILDGQSTADERNRIQLQQPNIEQDVTLAPEIKPNHSHPIADMHECNQVLLTGATGFFGAFLLRDLLSETVHDIYCLVRANSEREGLDRLMDNLSCYRLLDQDIHAQLQGRVKVVLGDLSQPSLGLEPGMYRTLAHELDAIIHNGAHVNFIYPYESLKAPNVDGTKEIIRLACDHHTKPIHFVSTLYVFPPTSDEQDVIHVEENTPLPSPQGLRMGYTQTKWVAENVLAIAQERGVPVNVYRLGRISGHSRSGACQTHDFIWSMIKGCIDIKQYPDAHIDIEMTPVDDLSHALITLFKSGPLNRQYHLFNTQPIDLQFMTSAIAETFDDLNKVPFDEWVHALSTQENTAQPLAQLIADGIFQGSKIVFDNRHVQEQIAGFGSVSITQEMIQSVIQYFIDIGYLAVPQSVQASAAVDRSE
nr:non-ribosomal peptide synthetase [Caldalkalibacillus salinus]